VRPIRIAGDLLARDRHPFASGHLAQLPVDPIQDPRLVEHASLERALELRTELAQMPSQPVHRTSAVGNEIVAVIEQQRIRIARSSR
jgi:hypothetical protein